MLAHQKHCTFYHITGGSDKICTCWLLFNGISCLVQMEIMIKINDYDLQSALHGQETYSPE